MRFDNDASSKLRCDPNGCELRPIPRTLSALLELAVEDCKSFQKMIDRSPDTYAWNMDTYVEFDIDGGDEISACMAGAVMLQRYGRDVPERTPVWAAAIDQMRMGSFTRAYLRMVGRPAASEASIQANVLADLKYVESMFWEFVFQNDDAPKTFSHFLTLNQYSDLATELERMGL